MARRAAERIYIGKVAKIALSGQTTPGRKLRWTWKLPRSFFPAIPVDSMVEPSTENLLSTKVHQHHQGKKPEPRQSRGRTR